MNKQLYNYLALVITSIFFSLPLLKVKAAVTYSKSSIYLKDTIPNQGNGIFINNASNNIIGQIGNTVANTVVGNKYGLYISGDNNLIFNNAIGTDTLKNDSLGNTLAGVFINGANNQIGGNSADSTNLIVSNGTNGIEIVGNAFRNNIIGNIIGTDKTGFKQLGNREAGISIINASDNSIGNSAEKGSNLITFNNDAGIAITGNLAINNTILINQLYSNGGLGIDLNHDGVTLNDTNDLDNGPNGLLNFPEVTNLYYDGEALAYAFSLDAPKGIYQILFYNNKILDPSGYGEGAFFLGSIIITHNQRGIDQYSGVFSPNFPPENEDHITLTVTELIGNNYKNSSEFSAYNGINSICENVISAGRISGTEANCDNYMPTSIVSLVSARGGTGSPIEYKWQKSLDNQIWIDIPNSNTAKYQPEIIRETTMFRRAARRLNCTEGWIYSNVITKDVARNISQAGLISGNETSLTPFVPSEISSIQPASGGAGQIEYQWYQRTDSSNWQPIPNEKGLNYSPPLITETTYYRREAHIISCEYTSCCASNPFLFSNSVTKRVVPSLQDGGEIYFSLKGLKRYDDLISILSTYLKAIKEKDQTAILLKADNTFNEATKELLYYQWEASENGKDWKDVYGATEKEYNLTPTNKMLFYRRKVRKKHTSNWVYSNVVKLPSNLFQENKPTIAPFAKKEAQKYPDKKMLLALNIFLEGALENTNLMRDDLRNKALLPLKSPYNSIQNHKTIQYLNSTILQKTGENAIVDWVFIELYPANMSNKKPIFTKSALIQRDGDIVDADGISPLLLESIPEGNYWIVIKHRNHESVISTRVIPLKRGMINAFVDFCLYTDTATRKKLTSMPSNIHQNKAFFRTLKNQRRIGYEELDYDMNGVLITKGPNNEYSSFLTKLD